MGTYNLPRNVKGEGRILYIFSSKALIYTSVGVFCALPFYFLMKYFQMTFAGIVIIAIFGIIGFSIATFKIPDSSALKLTKSVGGENIDVTIIRYIRFKMAKNRIYVATGEADEKEERGEENE